VFSCHCPGTPCAASGGNRQTLIDGMEATDHEAQTNFQKKTHQH
jgi:hypothetical protein